MATPRIRARSVVPVLTAYLVLVEFVPSGWVLPSFGDVGTPANIFALLAFIWYAASWLAGRIRPAPGTGAVRTAMWLFGASILLAYLALAAPDRQSTALETQAADRGLIGFLAWIGVVAIASSGIRAYAELQVLLRRAVVYGSFVGALGIIEFFTSTNLLARIHIPGLRASSLVGSLMTRGAYIRPASNTSQPLELAAVLALLLPFALQQALDPAREGWARRWFPVICIGGAMPLTVSRTSIIGLAVILVLTIPTWPPRRRGPALGVIVCGIGALKLAVPGLVSTTLGLFASFLGNSDDSTQARTADYAGVAQYIAQRPWFGRGYGTFIPSLYRYTDNMYLLALVELGIVGVLALLGLYLTGWRCARLGRRLTADPVRREVGQCFAAAMAAALILSATFDSLGFPMFAGLLFLLLGLSGAYLGIMRREAAEHRDALFAEAATIRMEPVAVSRGAGGGA